MFSRFHQRRKQREQEGGFTLIELLVVILIIAILAAIAIPVFLNQRKKGWRSQIQSALKNAATAMESYATENNGNFTTSEGALVTEGYRQSSGIGALTFPAAFNSATSYCIQTTHVQLTSAGDTWATAHYKSAIGEPRSGACA